MKTTTFAVSSDSEILVRKQSEALRMGDRIFLRHAKGSGDELTILSQKIGFSDEALYLACYNMKGTHLVMCSESHLNSYSYVGLFEIMPKISRIEGFDPRGITQDQMAYQWGKEIKYGERVVLRHVYSEKNLAINLSNPGKKRGSWELELEESDSMDTAFIPFGKNIGETVKINDTLGLVFREGPKTLYLNINHSGRFKPAADIVSGKWNISLFERENNTGISYNSAVVLKDCILNMTLCKYKVEDKNKLILQNKEEGHNLWVFERSKDFQPYTMKAGDIEYNTQLFVRNLATKKYLAQDLSLVTKPRPEDHFYIVQAPNDYSNRLEFGSKIALKNSEDAMVSVPESSYKLDSLSKIMSHEHKMSSNGWSSVELNYENSFCTFEIVRPLPNYESLIRNLNLIEPVFRDFSDFVSEYGNSENKMNVLVSLLSPETPKYNLTNICEEILASTNKLISMILKRTDFISHRDIQYYMYRMKIHVAVLNLIGAISHRIYTASEHYFPLNSHQVEYLEEAIKPLWGLLQLSTEHNTMICTKMLKRIDIIMELIVIFPEKISSYIAMLLESAYPNNDYFEHFIMRILGKLQPINEKNLEFDMNCLAIAYHAMKFKNEIIIGNQEVIRMFFLNNYTPVKFIFEEHAIDLMMNCIKDITTKELVQENPKIAKFIKSRTEHGITLRLKDFVRDKMYAEFLINYLKLYTAMSEGMHYDDLLRSYDIIGLNKATIEIVLASHEIDISIKKEFLFLAVTLIISSRQTKFANKYCLKISGELLNRTYTEIFHPQLKKNNMTDLLISLWEDHHFSLFKSSTDIKFYISLLEISLALAQKQLINIDILEQICLFACDIFNNFSNINEYESDVETLHDLVIYLEKIVKSLLGLLEEYTEFKMIVIGEGIVFNLIQKYQDGPIIIPKNQNVELIPLTTRELPATEKEDMEIKVPDLNGLFPKNISITLVTLLKVSNKIDKNTHLRILKLMETCCSPSKKFFYTMSQFELYKPDSMNKYIKKLLEIKAFLTDPNIERALRVNDKKLKQKTLKELRLNLVKLLKLIDLRSADKFFVTHMQNFMRNLGIFENIMKIWKMINNFSSYKTVVHFVAFLYSFTKDNPSNQHYVRMKFTAEFYRPISLLAASTQQITNFADLSATSIKNYIRMIINTYLFSEVSTFPSITKWLVALIFKNPSKVSHKYQAFITENILLQLNKHFDNRISLEHNESVGESLYVLSFCCIDNTDILNQYKHYFKYNFLVKFLQEDRPFSLKRGVFNLMCRLYKDQCDELITECLTLIDYFELNIEQISHLARRGLYEMIPPAVNAYKVEINHSIDQHDELLYLAWTFASYEYTYGNTGVLYFLPDLMFSKEVGNYFISKLENLQSKIMKTFEEDFKIEKISNDITKCIRRIKRVYREDSYVSDTNYSSEQYWNKLFRKSYNSLYSAYYIKDTQYYELLTDTIIQECAFFNFLVNGILSDDDKKRVLNFLTNFIEKSNSVFQIKTFYKFLITLFNKCKKKSLISEILIESDIISQSINLIQNKSSPKLQHISLKFLSTTARQKKPIIKDLILTKLYSLEVSFSLFTYIHDILWSTTKELLIKLNSDAYKIKLSKRFLKLLSSLCNNNNSSFQAFMETQTLNDKASIKNVSLVRVVFEILADLTDKPNLIVENKPIKIMTTYALGSLIEFTTGPCESNQAFLLNNVQTYSIINSLFSFNYNLNVKEDIDLYKYAVNFLTVLTEEDPPLPFLMGKYLDINLILLQIRKLFNVMADIYNVKDSKKLSLMIVHIEGSDFILRSGVNLLIFVIKFESHFPFHNDVQGLIKKDNFYYGRVWNFLTVNKDINQKQRFTDEREEIAYFKSFIGSVEVERNGRILRHYFQIPYRWRLLTSHSAKRMIQSVDHTSRVDKLEYLIESIPFIQKELEHQEYIRTHKYLDLLTKYWYSFGQISYIFPVIMNISVLILAQEENDIYDQRSSLISFILEIGSICLLLIIAFSVTGYAIEYYPIIVLSSIHKEKQKVDISKLLYNSNTVLGSRNLRNPEHSIKLVEDIDDIPNKIKFFYVLKKGYIVYHIFYLFCIVFCWIFPVCYPFLLLDIMKRSPTLKDVFKSITMNWKQLLLSFVLGIIFIFIYGTIAFLYLSENYVGAESDHTEFYTYCGNLWECTISTFYIGFRLGGGIGEGLLKPDIADAINYYERIVFDLTFFMIINVILMDVIFGIIIDTFAELRDIRKKQRYYQENVCFICHQKRNFFELHDESFVNHTLEAHNIWAYVFFFSHLGETQSKNCTGIEKYVKSCLKNENISFFPTNSKLLRDQNINPD